MTMKKPAASRSNMIKAALGCFKKYGVHRTSMADVAEAAGVSRQTLYRLFPSRADLLEQIIEDRILAMAESLRPLFAEYQDLREALVDGSIKSVEAARKDTLFSEIVEQGGDHRLDQFLLRGSEAVQKLITSLWENVLQKARDNGELRSGVSNQQAVEWIRSQHTMLALRDDYDEATQRRVLETFVVPSLVVSKPPQ